MSIDEKPYRAACAAYADVAGKYALHNAAMEKALEAYEAAKQPEQTVGDVARVKAAIVTAFENVGVVDRDRDLLYEMSHEDIAAIATEAAIAAMPAQPDTSAKRLAEAEALMDRLVWELAAVRRLIEYGDGDVILAGSARHMNIVQTLAEATAYLAGRKGEA